MNGDGLPRIGSNRYGDGGGNQIDQKKARRCSACVDDEVVILFSFRVRDIFVVRLNGVVSNIMIVIDGDFCQKRNRCQRGRYCYR